MAQAAGKPDPKSNPAEFNATNANKPQVPIQPGINVSDANPAMPQASPPIGSAPLNQPNPSLPTATSAPLNPSGVGTADASASEAAKNPPLEELPSEENKDRPAPGTNRSGPATKLTGVQEDTAPQGGTIENPAPIGGQRLGQLPNREKLDQLSEDEMGRVENVVVLVSGASVKVAHVKGELHWVVVFKGRPNQAIDCGFDENRARRIVELIGA